MQDSIITGRVISYVVLFVVVFIAWCRNTETYFVYIHDKLTSSLRFSGSGIVRLPPQCLSLSQAWTDQNLQLADVS